MDSKVKTIPVVIDDKEYIVSELKVRQIRDFATELQALGTKEKDKTKGKEQENEEDKKEGVVLGFVKKWLPICVKGLHYKETIDMFPSDLEMIYDSFLEVNSSFLKIVSAVGGDKIIIRILKEFQSQFIASLQSSLPAVMMS